jgi:hypothetical protein
VGEVWIATGGRNQLGVSLEEQQREFPSKLPKIEEMDEPLVRYHLLRTHAATRPLRWTPTDISETRDPEERYRVMERAMREERAMQEYLRRIALDEDMEEQREIIKRASRERRHPSVDPKSPFYTHQLAWLPCSRENIKTHQKDISALAYCYGRELQQKLKVPVGIIHAPSGGLPSALVPLDGYKMALDEKKTSELTWMPDTVENTFKRTLGNKKNRTRVMGAQNRIVLGGRFSTSLYNGTIHPIVPYGIRGVIMYCSDFLKKDKISYKDEMRSLIEGWRSAWKQGDFPFYCVLFAPSHSMTLEEERNGYDEWDKQMEMLSIPNTGMAIISDLYTNEFDMNNPVPYPAGVASRLSQLAFSRTYGFKCNDDTGPMFKKAYLTPDRKRIIVEFTHVNSGLTTRSKRELSWFKFYKNVKNAYPLRELTPAKARIIDKDKIEIIHEEGAEELWFAWARRSVPNLCNGDGFPASPFRWEIPKAPEEAGQDEKKEAVAQITFFVKDDFGKPLKGIGCSMMTPAHPDVVAKDAENPEEFLPNPSFRGTTDKNGKVVITGNSLSGKFICMAFATKFIKYYETRSFVYPFKKKAHGRWEPWNPTIEIICKPVLNPIPYIGGGSGKNFNKNGNVERAEFDLFANDWVKPRGKGRVGDILFTFEEIDGKKVNSSTPDYRLKITFPNKGDGIQSSYAPLFDHRNKNELGMPRYAPTEGYQDSLELKLWRDEEGHSGKREDQNYFIRVRTVLDKNGKVKSAFYGKIPGNIRFDPDRHMEFSYELNPKPLDVNMEFDREKNLLHKSWQKK